MRRVVAQKTWWFLAAGWFLCAGATAEAADRSQSLVSRALLEPVNLAEVWRTTLPVQPDERLDMLMVLNDRLYIRSRENYVWSLDRHSGDVIFSRSIAPAGFPVLGWNVYDDRIITVIDNQVVELNADTGARERVTDLDLSIIAPVVRNSEFFYVSASDRRLHLFQAGNMVERLKVSADNDSPITSVLAGEDMVVFATDRGNLVAMEPDAPRKLWQFNAPEGMAGPVVRDGNSFFFANKDTCVYRVDAVAPDQAGLVWRYQTEAVLDRKPRVTATTVYQYAPGRGVTAIGRRSGQEIWTLPEGVDLLAESGHRAYVFTQYRTLVVMDNTSGQRLYWVNFADVSDYAANVIDAKLYVADQSGRILCAQPTR